MHIRMDWTSLRFDWNHARAFLVTAEEGSLSAAARALGMTQPTLGRQVSALETELGVTLFERVGRGLVLTQAGTRLLEHMRAMGEAAAAAGLTASGQQQDLTGHVAITASEIYSAWLLPPVLARLRETAPGLSVELVASNAIRDLKRREADIAIRNARPDQPDLIARQVAEDAGTFYGTHAYLDALGPIDAAGLARARIIGLDGADGMIQALNAKGVPVTQDNFVNTTNSHAVHWALGCAGLGICVGPCGLGDAEPRLRRAVPDLLFRYPVWLVAHRELHTSPRIRLVWDTLAEMVPKLLKS